jgi:hypothetical protein
LDADTIEETEGVGVTDEIVVDRIVAHGINDDRQ